MTLGEEMALRMYGYGRPVLAIVLYEKVPCPICGKLCGGKSDRGQFDGVHQHLKFKHGVKKKHEREALLLSERNDR